MECLKDLLVTNWKLTTASRARVREATEATLDAGLPAPPDLNCSTKNVHAFSNTSTNRALRSFGLNWCSKRVSVRHIWSICGWRLGWYADSLAYGKTSAIRLGSRLITAV